MSDKLTIRIPEFYLIKAKREVADLPGAETYWHREQAIKALELQQADFYEMLKRLIDANAKPVANDAVQLTADGPDIQILGPIIPRAQLVRFWEMGGTT